MDINTPPYDKFIGNSDVAEEIRVFPDYIQYNTWCGPCWVDYVKYNYKVEGNKLFIKAFEAKLVEFGKDYEETDPFCFLKNGKVNKKIIEKYKKRMVENGKRINNELKEEHKDDPYFQKDYSNEDEKEDLEHADQRSKFYYEILAKWHEFKYIESERYSRKAKKRILKKIENKDWDK